MAPLARSQKQWPWFAGWVVVGFAWSRAGVAVLSAGLFVVPGAVVGTVLLARKGPPGSSRLGFLAGLGLTPLYVAHLNREGPGNVCSEIAHRRHSCLQAWNPRPWEAVGTALVTLGISLFIPSATGSQAQRPRPAGREGCPSRLLEPTYRRRVMRTQAARGDGDHSCE